MCVLLIFNRTYRIHIHIWYLFKAYYKSGIIKISSAQSKTIETKIKNWQHFLFLLVICFNHMHIYTNSIFYIL